MFVHSLYLFPCIYSLKHAFRLFKCNICMCVCVYIHIHIYILWHYLSYLILYLWYSFTLIINYSLYFLVLYSIPLFSSLTQIFHYWTSFAITNSAAINTEHFYQTFFFHLSSLPSSESQLTWVDYLWGAIWTPQLQISNMIMTLSRRLEKAADSWAHPFHQPGASPRSF